MTTVCQAYIRGFLPGRPSSPYKALERNALSHSTRLIEFIQFPLKKLPTNPWYSNGRKISRGLRRHLHGQNKEGDPETESH